MPYGHALVRILAPLGLAIVQPAALAAPPACPEVAEPPAAICRTTPHGLAYADTQDDVRLAVRALDAAVLHFQRHFRRNLPPGLLVVSSTFTRDDAERFAHAHGLGFTQRWRSPEARRSQVESALQRAMPDADAATIAHVLTNVGAHNVDTLRHGLGHALFRAVYWPGVDDSTSTHYGTPAPDWLDEAAALLMEGKALRLQREAYFAEALRRLPSEIVPLADFLRMEHPVTAQARLRKQAQTGPQTDSDIHGTSGSDSHAIMLFYAQSLAFADFLIATSGNHGIHGAISAAEAQGVDFADWLAEAGARHHLPHDIPALQAAWEAWCIALPDTATDPAG